MTNNEERGTQSTPVDNKEYEEAELKPLPEDVSSSSATGAVDFINTIYTASGESEKRVRVNPTRVEKAMRARHRNRRLQEKGLG